MVTRGGCHEPSEGSGSWSGRPDHAPVTKSVLNPSVSEWFRVPVHGVLNCARSRCLAPCSRGGSATRRFLRSDLSLSDFRPRCDQRTWGPGDGASIAQLSQLRPAGDGLKTVPGTIPSMHESIPFWSGRPDLNRRPLPPQVARQGARGV